MMTMMQACEEAVTSAITSDEGLVAHIRIHHGSAITITSTDNRQDGWKFFKIWIGIWWTLDLDIEGGSVLKSDQLECEGNRVLRDDTLF